MAVRLWVSTSMAQTSDPASKFPAIRVSTAPTGPALASRCLTTTSNYDGDKQNQGKPQKSSELRQRAANEQIVEAVGECQIEYAADQRCGQAHPGTQERVHGDAGEAEDERQRETHGVEYADAGPVQQRRRIVKCRRIVVEYRVSVLKGEVWKPAWEENARRKRLAQTADALEMEESIRRLRPTRCGKIESECGSGE